MAAARKEEYNRYIKSTAWGRKKKEARAYYKETCRMCGITSEQLKTLSKTIKNSLAKYLHVHHITYDNFKAEKMSDLCLLCEPCHAYVHEEIDKRACKKRGIKRVPGCRKFDEEASREIIAEIGSAPLKKTKKPKKPRIKKKKYKSPKRASGPPKPKSKRKKPKGAKYSDWKATQLDKPLFTKEAMEKAFNDPGFQKTMYRKKKD